MRALLVLAALAASACGKPSPGWTFRAEGDGTAACSCTPTAAPMPSEIAAAMARASRDTGSPVVVQGCGPYPARLLEADAGTAGNATTQDGY